MRGTRISLPILYGRTVAGPADRERLEPLLSRAASDTGVAGALRQLLDGLWQNPFVVRAAARFFGPEAPTTNPKCSLHQATSSLSESLFVVRALARFSGAKAPTTNQKCSLRQAASAE